MLFSLKTCSVYVIFYCLTRIGNLASATSINRSNLSSAEANQFSAYSCTDDGECLEDGLCLATGHGGKLCNCSEYQLGPYCEYSLEVMREEFSNRPLVRSTFLNCLNETGSPEDVHALSVYHVCLPGDASCWIRVGGADAIKVFFWCLNTGYRLLLSEGLPSLASRNRLLENAINSQEANSLMTGSSSDLSAPRLEENIAEEEESDAQSNFPPPRRISSPNFYENSRGNPTRRNTTGNEESLSFREKLLSLLNAASERPRSFRRSFIRKQSEPDARPSRHDPNYPDPASAVINNGNDLDYFGAPDADLSVAMRLP